jgi:hypothetical protein
MIAMQRSLTIIMALLIGSAYMAGCTLPVSYRKAPQKAIEDAYLPGHFKKRIALLKLDNRSSYYRANSEHTFQTTLTKGIRRSGPDLILVTPADKGFPASFRQPPRKASGSIDNFALSQIARQEGFNAVVIGTLVGLAVRETKEGMWWFREDHAYLKIHFVLEIYDPHSAAMLLSEAFLHEFEITPDEGRRIKASREADLPQLTDIVKNIANNMGKRVTNILTNMLWTASVVAMEGEHLVIPFGQEANVRVGDELEAYDGSRTIQGAADEKFILPGFKLGEIRIAKVWPDRSEGLPISGDPIPVGSMVVPNP